MNAGVVVALATDADTPFAEVTDAVVTVPPALVSPAEQSPEDATRTPEELKRAHREAVKPETPAAIVAVAALPEMLT